MTEVTNSRLRVLPIVCITISLLLVPLITMQFTDEVNWDATDFLVMGILIFLSGCAINLVLVRQSKYRLLYAIGIVVLFLLAWAELAVGVFTSIGS